jgi:major histocompatibility complex class I
MLLAINSISILRKITINKKIWRGAGEMAQQLRALTGRVVVAHPFNPSTQEAEAGGFLSSRPAWSTE